MSQTWGWGMTNDTNGRKGLGSGVLGPMPGRRRVQETRCNVRSRANPSVATYIRYTYVYSPSIPRTLRVNPGILGSTYLNAVPTPDQ